MVSNRKIKNLKVMWQLISQELKEAGYIVTPLQVENKFKTLERAYKNMLSNNKKTGRGRIGCSYEIELTKILGKRHNIVPLTVSGRDGLKVRKEMANIMDNTSSNESSGIPVLIPMMQTTALQITQSLSRELPIENNIPDESAIRDIDNESALIEASIPETVTHSLGQKKRKSGHGTTAKALDNCQQEIKKYKETLIQCQRDLNATQTQILLEYTQIRILQEESVATTKEHRQIILQQREKTNNLLAERNDLLKELIDVIKNNQRHQ